MKVFGRFHRNIFLPILAAFLAFSVPALRAERIEDLPQPTDYVGDYAHVLSPEAIARIDSICAQLDHAQGGAQIAVVTVHTLDGEDTADYATRLYEKMKIGSKATDRGVLILLAVDDHKRFISTGYGVEGILNDAKVGDIGRAMVPDLRARNYDGAVLLAVGEVAQDIAADANITLNEDTSLQPHNRPVNHGAPVLAKLILLVLVLIFFGGFSLLRMLFGWGLFFGGWGGGGWRGGGYSGWGGGGGGWGGGSGGGGFGGFGGGSTGGGGAGGSW
jgi:uncharacterized protein